ncbi:tRNA threonylcarbamoyladenosine dehydratase [Diplocloster agilis]|uniref:tRNA threonylcarbamoyladenosine dehydratase n=1 Tax=Diplocloster agilis TaxID=2850323 RepID=UPI000820509C|nr:tRNA threonylcarbamoyladenosine dehydratase [Suonthocola fibrivorans]MCU6735418.1 tRNA threonylcarbamoyladenosine dehydratase [Suonthocola fibrivorans]SCJ73407.1 Molybdopterin-synthase adenylyltransferase [uncultured Clostridium sp.]
MIDEFSRTRMLLGEVGVDKLKNSKVLVFGVGGVGSHCIEALARSGVGTLILVDHDTVSLTNINRQVVALHSTIGRQKTEVMRERILDIHPGAQVQALNTFVLEENAGDLITEDLDYVVDAVDTVTAKLAIAEHCNRTGIPLISSMGTGNKLNPSRFQIADIYETAVCPLCRVMRRELKKRGIPKLKVLYSDEQPVDTKAVQTDEDAGEKRSIPGSVAFVPPVAGILIAREVILDLCES